MYRIRRFGIVQTATTVAVLYMVAIAVVLVPFALLATAIGSSIPVGGGGTFDVSAVILFVLVVIVGYGIVTWIGTAIACAVYNLVAGWVGGIQMQLDAVAPPPPVPTWAPPPQAPPPVPPSPTTITPAG